MQCVSDSGGMVHFYIYLYKYMLCHVCAVVRQLDIEGQRGATVDKHILPIPMHSTSELVLHCIMHAMHLALSLTQNTCILVAQLLS